MPRQIAVNLPVKDLDASVTSFAASGFRFDSRFIDENATWMIVGCDSVVMRRAQPFFATSTDRASVDARRQTGAPACLSCDSDQEVDALVAKEVAAGGQVHRSAQGVHVRPRAGRSDRHVWERVHMRRMPG